MFEIRGIALRNEEMVHDVMFVRYVSIVRIASRCWRKVGCVEVRTYDCMTCSIAGSMYIFQLTILALPSISLYP
jgi:hypothetical protein